MKFFSEDLRELKSRVFAVEIAFRAETVPKTEGLAKIANDFRTRCGSVDTAFDLVFLSKVHEPIGLYCVCHGHLEPNKIDHFVLALRRRPPGKTPADVKLKSSKLGGFPEGLNRFFTEFSSERIACKVRLTLFIPVRILKVRPSRKARRIGGYGLVDEEITFLRKTGKSKIEVMVNFSGGETAILNVQSAVKVRLTNDVFEETAAEL